MISLYRKIQQQKSGEQGVKQQQPSCAHQRNGSTATCERPNAPTSGKSGQGLQQSSPAPVAVTASDAEPERHPTPQSSQIKDSKCEACVEEKRAARKYRLKLVLGLIFPFALQALDVTIVASALPWIAKDFNEISQLNWIISAFNLTSAAFIPFWGQMADVFGRHAALQATVIIMMIGSAFCTAAPTDAFPVLLLGRGIQGLGCAGISVIVRVIIADKVSLKENAKNWSIFSFTAGMSYAIGPVIGGYLTTAAWRWCFAINLPICVVAIAIIFLVLRKDLLGPVAVAPQDAENIQQQHHANEEGLQTPPANQARLARFYARLVTVDVGGQLLFLFGFGLVVLAMTWAGATYAWNSAAVLAPLLVGVALVVAFVFWERLMAPGGVLALRFPRQKAMLPWDILKNKDVGLLCFINFATGAAMYSVRAHLFFFCSAVTLRSAVLAGAQLTRVYTGSLLLQHLLYHGQALRLWSGWRAAPVLYPWLGSRCLPFHVPLQQIPPQHLCPDHVWIYRRGRRRWHAGLGSIPRRHANHLRDDGLDRCRYRCALSIRPTTRHRRLPQQHRDRRLAHGRHASVRRHPGSHHHDDRLQQRVRHRQRFAGPQL
ncbi:hypothetical protein MCOR27_010703 [Pyricularia oryzae]|nr:hypothetical protein MCOR27_010703 [Pyricularia oryzae]KAI6324895.1 hypothetical protein MCOR30_007000 [Pyricularia oryzae]